MSGQEPSLPKGTRGAHIAGVEASRAHLPTTLGEGPGARDPPLLPQHSTAPQWSTHVPSCHPGDSGTISVISTIISKWNTGVHLSL